VAVIVGVMGDWVPAACTLPTVEQPLRVREFDAVFAGAIAVDRPAATRLRLTLPGDRALEARVRDLAARESDCCSFFAFTLTPAAGRLTVDVDVPAGRVAVLDALTERAARGMSRPAADMHKS
jgi:hypothetical protein